MAVTALDPSLQALRAGLMAGDRRALGRAISLVEAGDEAGEALCAQLAPTLSALIVGFTGTPGAGKSTLISAYVGWLRAAGKRVAILAVDPSSPFTGGAILGDRIRMIEHLGDAGVFIRSLASRGHLGGLTATFDKVLAVVDAAGWDVIILESVGIGQSETEISAVADVNVLIVAPGHGDDVQAMKAGALEAASLIVINKSDLPGAEQSYRHMSEMVRLTGRDEARLVRASASTGDGVEAVGCAIERQRLGDEVRIVGRIRRRIMSDVECRFRRGVAAVADSSEVDRLIHATRSGELTISQAAALAEGCVIRRIR